MSAEKITRIRLVDGSEFHATEHKWDDEESLTATGMVVHSPAPRPPVVSRSIGTMPREEEPITVVIREKAVVWMQVTR